MNLVLYVLGGLVAFYAVVILLIALAGVVLAARHAGEAGAALLDTADAHQVRVGWGYIALLLIGLFLFYAAVALVAIGLVAATAAVIYLMCLQGTPAKVIIAAGVFGCAIAWALLKSFFAVPHRKPFGNRMTETECPRLHAALAEVAARLQTDLIEEVYINPGAAIEVWQEGGGTFGFFAVRSRVLTLGLATLRYLSISELKAILAHEYGHCSRHDPAYGRFIRQVTLSNEQALANIAAYMGQMNYVNPFFGFFWLYQRSYMILAAGFLRSQEFMADRRAVSLYGKDAFLSGLVKVSTDGAFFESTIRDNIASLLGESKALANVYETFRSFRDEGLSPTQREEMYRAMLMQKRSPFAPHPSFHERVEAVSGFPAIDQEEPASAESLFEDLTAVEQELTDYLTVQVRSAGKVPWHSPARSS